MSGIGTLFFPYCISQWNNLDSRKEIFPPSQALSVPFLNFLDHKPAPTYTG